MANQGSGKKGRFAERLRRMRINRLKRKKGEFLIEDAEVAYKNFLKIVSVIPLVVVGNVFDKPKTDVKNGEQVDSEEAVEYYFRKRKIDRKKVESIDVSSLKKRQTAYVNSVLSSDKNQVKETPTQAISIENVYAISKEEQARKLEKKIIDIMHTDMVRMVNQLEVYESELYILSEINQDEKTLAECRENIVRVKRILAKIETIKKRYDYLKDNYDFEYLLESNNDKLIDRIIELRNLVGSSEIKATVNDYKLLDVYKYLYLKIDDIHRSTYNIEQEKLKQEEKLRERDIDFDKLKNDVYNVDKIKRQYEAFVKQQNDMLSDLQSKISKIDSHESINYRIKGYGKYFFSSMKYLGLLALSPLRGLVPGIATETIIAGNVVKNLRDNMVFEERRKMVYEAVDYSNMLYNTIYDLENADLAVDAALNDLAKFKMEYNDKFKQYQGDFSQYRDVIEHINSLQKNMINSKIKIEFMKNRALEYEQENKRKMGKVRKLNATSQTTVINKRSAA